MQAEKHRKCQPVKRENLCGLGELKLPPCGHEIDFKALGSFDALQLRAVSVEKAVTLSVVVSRNCSWRAALLV